MIGPRKQLEPTLYYTGFNLSDRIPADHLLRRLKEVLDLGFVRPAVARFYGNNGNESIDPIVLLKLMLLLKLENVPSERQLVERLAFRLDWMWFCNLDLNDPIPDHSVLSKARALWGLEVFETLFGRVLQQCIAAGLVEGRVIHVDASCIAANADPDVFQPVMRLAARELYEQLDRQAEGTPAEAPSGRLTSPTDPEAGVTRNRGRVICGYKDHRAVDDAHGIVTATITTDAAVNEGQVLERVIQAHEANTGDSVGLVVADTQYGTGENYRKLHEAGITPCIPPKSGPSPKGKFPASAFTYDARRDCYRCPGGRELHRERHEPTRRRVRYRATKEACAACPLRNQCTRSVRHVQRHEEQEHIDWAASCLSPGLREYWRKRRSSVVEGRFGDAATHHGYKRARWRGRAKVTIQNLLIATCQNLRKLVRALRRRPHSGQGTLPGIHLAHCGLYLLESPGIRILASRWALCSPASATV